MIDVVSHQSRASAVTSPSSYLAMWSWMTAAVELVPEACPVAREESSEHTVDTARGVAPGDGRSRDRRRPTVS